MTVARAERSSVTSMLLGSAAGLAVAATLVTAGMLTIATPQAEADETTAGATTLSVGGITAAGRPAAKRATHGRRALHPAKVKRPAAVAPGGSSSARATPALPPVAVARCHGADLTPAPGNESTVEAATLCLINEVRAEHHIGALVKNAKLLKAAVGHDDDMLARGYFNHVGPAGDTPKSRMLATGYATAAAAGGCAVGENIAAAMLNLATPSATVASWVASPPHLANILYARFRDTGIAVVAATPAVLGSDGVGATYTEDFGVA
jgi:uncharacterized protein YkwD